ncbi:MmcQ/YjbR family DNA-binding protein [candidate division KSB1 bacterium]|nr:MmcQ/YjbR family DNA-binding protein [candidate division KSB1 bacterium]
MTASDESRFFPLLQEYCLSLPNTRQETHRNKIALKVGKRIFMMKDADVPLAITVKSSQEKNAILLEHPHICQASYMGRFGWISITVPNHDSLNLAKELILESYLIVSKLKPKHNGGYDATKF